MFGGILSAVIAGGLLPGAGRSRQPLASDQAAAGARSTWAQLKADATAKRDDVKAKIDKRTRQLDSKAAASEPDWAEAEAADALDFAEWAIDNAQLAMLDAIDARAYADDRAKAAGS